MNIVFDAASFYYLPQYLPVAAELRHRGAVCHFVLHADAADPLLPAARAQLEAAGHRCDVVGYGDAALALYRERRPDWVIFGNDCRYLDRLPPDTRTALLYHGIGVKACYYDAALARFSVRFSEGAFRTAELQRLYPGGRFVDVGFAKLDPLLDGGDEVEAFDLRAAGLDPARPTVLYAPTFYPSSIECLSRHWPAELGDVNVLVKPHLLTWTSEKYAAQRKRLQAWSQLPNVHVAEPAAFSLLPFMAVADVLVSEASSAIFEFAALGRPVVWCDFYRLRWSYRGPLRFRHERRMDQTINGFRDVGAHVSRPGQLPAVIRQELAAPQGHAAGRARCTSQLIGNTDGQASVRIADYLLGTSSRYTARLPRTIAATEKRETTCSRPVAP